MKTTFIYALCEPGTRSIRYIGKTNTPKKRLKQHWYESVKKTSYLGNWLRSLKSKGTRPELIILREVPMESWQGYERRYIRVCFSLGIRLTNGNDGGWGGNSPTPEVLEKMSAWQRDGKNPNLGRKYSPEHCAALSAMRVGEKNSFFGKHHTPESKALIRASHIGKKHSVEVCLAKAVRNFGSGNPFFGEKHTEETRATMRLSWTSERHAEASARFSGERNPMFGKKRTEDSIRKLKETLARKKALKESI